jgi:LCP family protein required for cell wall assembly
MTWGEPGPPPLWGAAGKAGYMLACVIAALLLVISGFSYFAVKDVSGIGSSHAIASGPSIGEQNILLMGLESRTDWDGNVLPPDILAAMHAGSVRGVTQLGVGGNATNTLILLHIPAGGASITGYSIPRDDWVTFAGVPGPQQQGKIDQAYGVSMYYTQERLRSLASRLSREQIAYLGNEAGRAATVATVEQLTGVRIDHFAEVNMVGFYDLAKVLGGVDVCLNHQVRDSYSGADFPAGYQHLYAAQALAFVRQRHGLQGGDLDRTRRQQAFLYSVIRQLRTEGVLDDLGKFQGLLSVAKRYVITDSGWNLMDFASRMRTLTSGNLVFRTLPVAGFGTIAHQDVNIVDPGRIKEIVRNGFYPPASASASASPSPSSASASPSPSSSAASPSPASVSASPSPAGLAAAAATPDPAPSRPKLAQGPRLAQEPELAPGSELAQGPAQEPELARSRPSSAGSRPLSAGSRPSSAPARAAGGDTAWATDGPPCVN